MARRVISRKKKSPVASAKASARSKEKKTKIRSRPAARAKEAAPKAPNPRKSGNGGPARAPHREADVPIEVLNRIYMPKQTSLKASFRSSGEERQRDQDIVAEERWRDEDHFTNKSGDPRIGTHHRKYEPGE